MLLNNGSESLAVPADGSFAFATALASGATFSVSIAAQPSGQLCSVTNGSGSVVDANVSTVGVSCVTRVAAGAGAEHGSGPDPIATISTNPGSSDLIRAALDAGTLTPEQGLIYAMYAEYEDPRVPAQYLGDDAGLIEGTAHEKVVDYIVTVGLANVSPATLDALKPFFIPAYHEGSYQRASVGAHDKGAQGAREPRAASPAGRGGGHERGGLVRDLARRHRFPERRDAGGGVRQQDLADAHRADGTHAEVRPGLDVVHRDRRPARRDARGPAQE